MRQLLRRVDGKELLERVRRLRHARRSERTGDQCGRAVSNHASDFVLVERLRATRDEQRVGRFGDVTARIYQRPVQVKDVQREHIRRGIVVSR